MVNICRRNQYHSQYYCDRTDSKHAVLFQGRGSQYLWHRFLHLISKQAYIVNSCANISYCRNPNDYNNAVDLDCSKWYGYQ